jgi:tetratricopeptide (TPR) repeat protein
MIKDLKNGTKPLWLLSLLAKAQYNIGVLHRKNGDADAALKNFEQALASQTALTDAHPSVIRFQEKLAETYFEIARDHASAKEPSKALPWINKAVDVLAALVTTHNDQASLHNALAFYSNFLGFLLDETRQNKDAIPPFQKAVSEQQLANEKADHAEVYKGDLCMYYENLGEQYVDLGQVKDGLKWYEQSLEVRRELRKAHPENREYTRALAQALIGFGAIRRREPNPSAARKLFAEAESVLADWRGTSSEDEWFKAMRADVYVNLANTLADENQLEEAKEVLEKATDLFRQLPGEGVVLREVRSESLWDIARLLRALKLTAEADQTEAERFDLWKTRPPEELVALALKHTDRANLIGYGKAPLSAQAKAVRELDLDQAADELRLAIARGFKDLRMLKSHLDSDVLLSRIDLAPALEDLAFPQSPFVHHP